VSLVEKKPLQIRNEEPERGARAQSLLRRTRSFPPSFPLYFCRCDHDTGCYQHSCLPEKISCSDFIALTATVKTFRISAGTS
jgi:hypothetical protein